MDVVTDLTSYTVSYISVLQDAIRVEAEHQACRLRDDHELWDAYECIRNKNDQFSDSIGKKIKELLWVTNHKLSETEIHQFFYHATSDVVAWLERNVASHIAWERHADGKSGSVHFTPHQWRTIVSKVLYAKPQERLHLADALHYMPIQIVFCLGGKGAPLNTQRLYQVWKPKNHYPLLSKHDLEANARWWDPQQTTTQRQEEAELLLLNDKALLNKLLETENPVPFETFFHRELDEICESRHRRLGDVVRPQASPFKNLATNPEEEGGVKPQWEHTLNDIKQELDRWYLVRENNRETGAIKTAGVNGTTASSKDAAPNEMSPAERAKTMGLVGLAFSGGGIRSATFNLGVLQHLAEKGLLHYVDYLSTVSGGGYIGSWLVSWIKEAGTVTKVSDRLNTKKSVNPMGEEVRPVRWLRMFSNFLTPNASIMSADAWTVGITWLRNTLVNQIILLLLTCTCLSFILMLFFAWKSLAAWIPDTASFGFLFLWGGVALIPACVLIGLGMNTYANSQSSRGWMNIGRHRFFSIILNGWAFLAAFCISAWMLQEPLTNSVSYSALIKPLLPVAIIGCLGVIATAYLGRYHDSWAGTSIKWRGDVAIFLSSVAAAVAGLYLLAGVWYLCRMDMQVSKFFNNVNDFRSRLLFIVAPPLVLEVFSIAVVVRMAIMGRLFPDGRREWWARMGAINHRFSLAWILAAFAALMFWELAREPLGKVNLLALAGGWSGIIGLAVNLAYKAAPQKDSTSGLSMKEMFIRFAPYLFIVGFVLLNSVLVTWASYYFIHLIYGGVITNLLPFYTLLTVALAAVTLLLSWRVGVNEFSLHYFYRNRLVRAYLGATRRRSDRSRTANDFTGFDEKDDHNLDHFRSGRGYYGPYPLLNTALNATVVSELDRQDRKAESFLFSPLFCGFDFSRTRSSSSSKYKVFDYGYRPTERYAYENGPTIGTALAISGAAVNPNMGFHSSQATAFLLTIFNVRLGWWMGNPRRSTWKNSDPATGITYIINDLVGKSDIDANYVCLSDGGHFDNMGLYELVRRRCKWIILSDAEEDQAALCEGLANAIRRCLIDFGAEIIMDVNPIITEKTTHVQVGKIHYAGEPDTWGTLIYIKTVLTGDEATDITEYQKRNPLFPNQSTNDQFFDEAQFESYRKLGYHSLHSVTLQPVADDKKDYVPVLAKKPASLSRGKKRWSNVFLNWKRNGK